MPRAKKPTAPGGGSRGTDREKQFERDKSRVARAIEVRTKWETDYQVLRCEEFLLGKQWSYGQDKLVMNHTWASIKAIMPNLFYTTPKAYVRPKPGQAGPTVESTAAIGEGVLDSIATQDGNLKKAGKLAVLQAFFRIGVLKVIHDPKIEPNPNAGDPIYQTLGDGTPVVDAAGQAVPMQDPQTGAPMLEPKEIVTDQAYRYQWVDATNMLLPDEGPDMDRWTWIGEEVVVPLDDAKADPRFPAEARNQFKANEVAIRRSKQSITRLPVSGDPDDGLFRYYEVYDLQRKELRIWADGQAWKDGYLSVGPTPDGIEDHPYAILPGYTPILGPEALPWPYPHVRPWLDVQEEYNTRRWQITEGAKRSARKGVYQQGAFSDGDQAVKLLQSPEDMTFAECADINQIKMLESPDLNPSIYKDVAMLQADWRIITGQSGARLSDPDADTATEATFVERASGLRDSDLQDAINDWLGVAFRKMLQLVRKTLTVGLWCRLRGYTDEEFVKHAERVYGIPREDLLLLPGLKDLFKERYAQEKWQPVTREQLQFEADVSVVAGSARPRNIAAEQRVLLQLIPAFAQNPGILKVRSLVMRILQAFDMADERLADELQAMAGQLIAMNANQAGRNPSGQGPLPGIPGMSGQDGRMMGAMIGAPQVG